MKDGQHKLEDCRAFKAKSSEEKSKQAKDLRLCFRCLRPGHFLRNCMSKVTCKVEGCGKAHHTLLHREARSNANLEKPPVRQQENSSSAYACNVKGLLPVIGVKVIGAKSQVETYALCDPGSTHSWIDNDITQTLDLKGKPESLVLSNIHGADCWWPTARR